MKKYQLIGLGLAFLMSFNANAGVWEDTQVSLQDLKGWVLNASKPLKPKW